MDNDNPFQVLRIVEVSVVRGERTQVPTRYQAEGITYGRLKDSLLAKGVGDGTFYEPTDDPNQWRALPNYRLSGRIRRHLKQIYYSVDNPVVTNSAELLQLSYRLNQADAVEVARRLEVLNRLIANGVNLDVSDIDYHMTLLHNLAGKSKALPLIRALIRAGANVNARDAIGATPIFFALGNEEFDNVEELVRAGADLYTIDNRGNTLLVMMAVVNKVEAVKYLLSQGLDILATNYKGETAEDEARRRRNIQLADYLHEQAEYAQAFDVKQPDMM